MIRVFKNIIKNTLINISNLLSLIFPIYFLLKSKYSYSLKNINFLKTYKKCIVLGNGPSLKNDFNEIELLKSDHDFVCVNNFVTSSYFEIFKPNKYIFQDTYFWYENAHDEWKVQRENTFRLLNEKVNWKLQIFIPIHADLRFFKEKINNKNIEIIQMKVFSMPRASKKFANFIFDSGYFGPCKFNVLITAIYLALYTKYKEVKVYGADMSFYKDIEVDQRNNNLIFTTRHFYGEPKTEIYTHNPDKKQKVTMFELMESQACIFNAHNVLNDYAHHLNIKIINKSSFSLIDAYKRA